MEDHIILHGSSASRMLRVVGTGVPLCVCVTLIDGLVLARSAFHHSMNYRSAVIFGTGVVIEDCEKKMEALQAMSEHLIRGRWAEVRKPNQRELKATSVVSVALTEFSLKIRTGPPVDDEEDYELPVWAGVLPLQMQTGEPIVDPLFRGNHDIPEYVKRYSR
jgi:nitroimidazol reductase NimA-like FMN-containing flavoprotein (pyridoxamine 5'-phosphate oxidase superfamily)